MPEGAGVVPSAFLQLFHTASVVTKLSYYVHFTVTKLSYFASSSNH